MGLKSYPRFYFELMFASFMLLVGMSLPAAFLPIFANDLDPSGTLVGFVVSSFFVSRIFIELPSGVLSDWFGRRKLLVGGLAIAAGGALMCSVADSVYILMIGRALWGLGTALFFMNNMALILDLFKSSTMGRGLGTFQSVEFIGNFLGAPIGGFIAGIAGYRQVFFIAFFFSLCSFFVAFISRSLKQRDIKTSEESKISVNEVFSNLRNWGLTVTYINSFSRLLIMQGVTGTIFPLFLSYHLGMTVELIGIIISLRTVGHIVATVTSGYFSDRFGRKPMIMTGLVAQSLCFYLYTVFPAFEPLLLIGFFEGFGEGTVFTSLLVLLYEVAPAGFKGRAIGMYRTFLDLGGFLGPPFFMLLFNSVGSYYSFVSAIIIFLLNIALLATLKRKEVSM